MILKDLRIKLCEYGKNKGMYIGNASFENGKGEIEIRLTPDHCDRIFKICADSIIEVAKEAAQELTVSVIEHQSKLEVVDGN